MKSDFIKNPLLHYEGYKEEFKLLKIRLERRNNVLNEETLPFIGFITQSNLASVQINAANEIKTIYNTGNGKIKTQIANEYKSLIDWVSKITTDKEHEKYKRLIEGRIRGFYNQIAEGIGVELDKMKKENKKPSYENSNLKDFWINNDGLDWDCVVNKLTQTYSVKGNDICFVTKEQKALTWNKIKNSEQWLYSFMYAIYKDHLKSDFKSLSTEIKKNIIRNTFKVSTTLEYKGFDTFQTEPKSKYTLPFKLKK